MPVGYSIYRDRASVVHQGLDPRTKFLWLFVLFGVALCFNNPIVLGATVAAILAVAFSAKLGWTDLGGFIWLSIWLTFLSVLIWPAYIAQGVHLFTLGTLTFTVDGVLFGVAMGFRITIMILAAAILMLTTSPQLITAGLLGLGLNYRVGTALSLTIRFIPLMNSERVTILEAQRARGADLTRGNPVRRAVKAAPVLVPLFGRAMMTAQNLTVAMDARGFGARDKRTNITRLAFGRGDVIICIVGVLVIGTSIALRLLGIGVLVKGML
ncbi:energy-coupling factor transporter transmembrane component T family protein [Leifsonia sp. NPDC056665]|uniref:energy-coupling factor transporter transmembrane component T family protein n=1 Tax=Leifsonia sp. NPDC056665 TaxID=3345901 RepID=UPI00367EC589